MILQEKNLFFVLGVLLSVILPIIQAEVQVKDNDGVMIKTSAGKVLGFRISTKWGNVVRFYGVPFAEPITKSNRFEASVPLLGQSYSSDNLRNQIIHGSESPPFACIQHKHLPAFSHPSLPQGGLNVAENCLMLNVYQPGNITLSDNLPMVLWVPGDGYSFADSVQYDGSAFAAKQNVIVVTMNYRVGVFGFASMGNSTMPGNAALTDIVSAIKFLQYNAKALSGDPAQITLAGRFSGSMAISTLVTSSLFYRGSGLQSPLVSRVILHGAVASSAYNVDKDPLVGLEQLALATGCNRGDGQHTLECLKMLDTAKLLETASLIGYSWRPSIDGITILKSPDAAIEFGAFSKSIVFLIGDNSGSGSICYTSQKYKNSRYLENFEDDKLNKDGFVDLVSRNIQEFYEEDAPQLTPLVAHEYFFRMNPNGMGSSWRDSYFRFCGAMYIRTPVEVFARHASRLNSVVYRYELAQRASTSINPSYFQGALGDEIIFTFPTEKTPLDDADKKVSDIFIESWATFIKTGAPSSGSQKWEQFNEMGKHMVGITKDGSQKSTSTFLDQDVHFWRDTFPPAYQAFSKLQGKDSLKFCPARNKVSSATSGGLGFFGMFMIIVVGAFVLVSVVYLIRNWQKPYLFKF